MEKQKALAPAPGIIEQSPEPFDFHLVATNPEAMAACQQNLAQWLGVKVSDCTTEVQDLSDALDIAIVKGWGTEQLSRQHKRAQDRLKYYSKLKAAVDAGFCIVPNFPVDFFAIRVNKQTPKTHYREIHNASDYQDAAMNIPDEKPTTLAIGEGRYVSPVQTVKRQTARSPDAKTGKDIVTKSAWASAFRDVTFPLVAARPEVMDATGNAMGLNIFDAIGICPPQRRGDPLIIGKIFGMKSGWGSSVNQQEVSFLIAWHLDLRVL